MACTPPTDFPRAPHVDSTTTCPVVATLAALLLSIGGLAGLGAQVPSSDPPKAVLREVIFDFGEMVRADVAEKSFEIRNEGGSTLLIREVQTTCACTVVDFPSSVAPGESGQIKVSLDTDFVDGAFQAQAFLYTNDPDKPKIELTLKVETQPYVSAHPGYVRFNLHQFYPADDPRGVDRQLVWASKPADFAILEVESPYDFLQIEFSEAAPEDRNPRHDGVQWMLQIRLPPDAPVGPLAGYLRVRTDHQKQKTLSIPISGILRPLFAITPANATLGDLDFRGEARRTSLHVAHSDLEPRFEITKAESDVSGLAFEIESVVEGREYWVHIILPPDLAKGPFDGTIQIHTSSEDQPVLTVPVSGNIR